MRSDDSDVTMARVTHEAAASAIGAVGRWVDDFAHRHGMRETSDVNVAVTEAVKNTVRHAYPADAPGEVTVDAATDGEWLTVRVADRGCGAERAHVGLGVPLMAGLADRLEIGAGVDDVGTVVVMEFPISTTDSSTRRSRCRGEAPARRASRATRPARRR
jgi:anti-sigma regulatory factor (Ser/Thr protein kinase)